MKGAGIVSIFLAVMVFVGSFMQPATVDNNLQNIETELIEVENF